MATLNEKDVLTTGEVARICHVAPRTVSKWFDTGKLRGYRIPGSRDRRIPVQQLVAFMRQHGIPLDGLEMGQCRLLIVSPTDTRALAGELERRGGYQVRTAATVFDAGIAAEQFHPQVIVLDLPEADETAELSRRIKGNEALQNSTVVVAIEAGGLSAPAGVECDATVARPLTAAALVDALQAAPVG